jgi:putative endonuclease
MAYFVYIMTNRKGGTLYIGVTNDLARRGYEHREKMQKGFTEKYNLNRLVYYESYPTAPEAIAREKAMKKWNRAWKIRRIEEMNPDWRDLYSELNG